MAASMVATWLSKSSAAFSISPSPLYGPVPGPCVVVEAAAVPLPYAGQIARQSQLESPSLHKHQFRSSFQKGLCPTDVTLIPTAEEYAQKDRKRTSMNSRH